MNINKNLANKLLIILYFIFRIVINQSFAVFLHPILDWAIILVDLFEYLIIAVLIILNTENLYEYNFGSLSTIIIILFGSILRTSTAESATGKILELLFWPIALVLFIHLLKNQRKIQWPEFNNLKWGLISVILPIILALTFTFIGLILSGHKSPAKFDLSTIINVVLVQLPFQMSHGAILEEPIFRGFFWGTLKKEGWGDKKTFLAVFILFILAHVYTIRDTYSFFFALPITTFVFGLIILKSRSITNSMVFHSIINTMIYISYNIIALFY